MSAMRSEAADPCAQPLGPALSEALHRCLPLALEVAPRRWSHVSKAVKSGAAELARNPRARSAVLRSGTRTGEVARESAPDSKAASEVDALWQWVRGQIGLTPVK